MVRQNPTYYHLSVEKVVTLDPVILRERVAFQGIQREDDVLVRCRFNRAGRDRAQKPNS